MLTTTLTDQHMHQSYFITFMSPATLPKSVLRHMDAYTALTVGKEESAVLSAHHHDTCHASTKSVLQFVS